MICFLYFFIKSLFQNLLTKNTIYYMSRIQVYTKQYTVCDCTCTFYGSIIYNHILSMSSPIYSRHYTTKQYKRVRLGLHVWLTSEMFCLVRVSPNLWLAQVAATPISQTCLCHRTMLRSCWLTLPCLGSPYKVWIFTTSAHKTPVSDAEQVMFFVRSDCPMYTNVFSENQIVYLQLDSQLLLWL